MSESAVLVTGATGFIGSQLVRRLLKSGQKVIGSNHSGASGNLEDVRDQVEIVRADLACFTERTGAKADRKCLRKAVR